MKNFAKIRIAVLFAAVVMAAGFFHSQVLAEEKPAFIKPPVKLNTALVVPEGRMAGKGYKLDAVALNDGYNNNYTLITEVGEVQAVSDYQLARQIQEIRALIILDEMSRAGVFGESMKEGLLAPFRGAKALVTSPVKTTTGAVKGIGRWLGNIGRAVASDDPYQEGGLSAATGWANTKRAFALELGIDPYTDWEPIQKSLTSVARAAFAGGITVGMAMGMMTEGTTLGTVIMVTSLTAEMNAILLDNPPEGLTKINREKLINMGISEKVIDPFLLNYNYTPFEKFLLVEALRRMDGAKGRGFFIALAASAPDRVIARYMQQEAEMMANYHNNIMAVDIIKIEKFTWLVNRKGTLLGIFPIDYLAWTSETSAVAFGVEKHAKAKGKRREIWLEGSASPDSKKALTSRGWKIKERVGLLTGEPLQSLTASGAGMGATATVIKAVTP